MFAVAAYIFILLMDFHWMEIYTENGDTHGKPQLLISRACNVCFLDVVYTPTSQLSVIGGYIHMSVYIHITNHAHTYEPSEPENISCVGAGYIGD